MADPVFDAAASTFWTGTGNGVWTHTNGSGSDRILLLGFTNNSGATVGTVTFGSTSGTLVFGATSTINGRKARIEVWQILSPATGAASITVTTVGSSSSTKWIGASCSYTGASGTAGTIFKSGQEKSTDAQSSSANVNYSHAPTADDSSLVVTVFVTNWSTTHDGLAAGQTERVEATHGGSLTVSIGDKAGLAGAVTVSGSEGYDTGGTPAYAWSHVLLPPQNVSVDVSSVPIVAVTAAAIGTVDDSNLLIGNLDGITGALSILATVVITQPLEADMVIGMG